MEIAGSVMAGFQAGSREQGAGSEKPRAKRWEIGAGSGKVRSITIGVHAEKLFLPRKQTSSKL
jgi:hypothetical protein